MVNGLLSRKLVRDLKTHWSQFFAVFLMALLSSLCYVGLEGAWHGQEASLDTLASEANLATGWVQTSGMTEDQIDRLRGTEGITRAETAQQLWASVSNDDTYIRLEVVTPGTISIPTVVQGEAPTDNKDGVWLDQSYVEAHDLKIGSVVSFSALGQDWSTTLLGVVSSPDDIYFTGSAALGAPEPSHFGYGYVSEQVVTGADQLPLTLMRVTGDTTVLQEQSPTILGESYLTFQTRATHAAVATAFDRVGQIRNLSFMFSGLFILLAILAMFTSIRRLVGMQRQEIATLQALGLSSRMIRSHYLSYGLVAGGTGAVIGALAAPIISAFVMSTQKTMFALPEWHIAYTPISLAVLGIIIAACVASAELAVWRPLSLTPAEGMRQSIGAAHHVLIERLTATWQHLKPGSKWALRDALMNRMRFLLGVVAAIGCMMLLFAGLGVSDSMYDLVHQVFEVERSHTQRVALTTTATDEQLDDLPDGSQLLQERTARYIDSTDRVLTITSPGDTLNLTFENQTIPDDDGIYITSTLAHTLGINAGTTINLTIPGTNRSLSGTVIHVFEASTPQGFYVSADYWKNHGFTFTPNVALTPAGTNRAELDDNPAVGQVVARSLQVDNGNRFVASLQSIFILILVFAIVLAVVVLYSLGSLAFVEKHRDFATLSVLGFQPHDLRALVGSENTIMTLIGLALGVPAGFWFLNLYVTMFNTKDVSYYSHIRPVSIIIAIAVTFISSWTTTLFLRRRIHSINAVEALKGIE